MRALLSTNCSGCIRFLGNQAEAQSVMSRPQLQLHFCRCCTLAGSRSSGRKGSCSRGRSSCTAAFVDTTAADRSITSRLWQLAAA
jgi:hypothetical protein